MAIIFNIKLPHELPDDFFNMMTEEERKDEDSRWGRIKEVIESYKELIEEEIPGAEVDIEW